MLGRWPAIVSVTTQSTTVAHHVDHHLFVLEYPVPMGMAVDAD